MLNSRSQGNTLEYRGKCGQWGAGHIPICWNPTYPLIATGSTLNSSHLRDVTIWTKERDLFSIIYGKTYLESIGWSSNGYLLALVSNCIELWTKDGNFFQRIPGNYIQWHPSKNIFLTYHNSSGKGFLWNIGDGSRIPIRMYKDVVFCRSLLFSWSPNGDFFVGCWFTNKGELCGFIWTSDGEIITSLTFPSLFDESIECLLWNPDGYHIVIRTKNHLLFFDRLGILHNCHPIRSTLVEGYKVVQNEWNANGELLATAISSVVQLWTKTGIPLHSIAHNTDLVTLAWHPIYPIIATAAWFNAIYLWTNDGVMIQTESINIPEIGPRSMQIPYSLSWNPTGTSLAASFRGSTVHLWDFQANSVCAIPAS